MVTPLTVNNDYTILYHGRRYERFYDDGVWCRFWPADEAEVLQAERAFRDAFVETAHRVMAWRSVDKKAIAAAWQARQRAMRQAEVLIPSADYFGVTDPEKRRRLGGRQVAYQPGHRMEASWLRGIHHAMVYIEQCWEEGCAEGAARGLFTAFVLPAWVSAVDRWAALPIRLGRCMPPPRPLEVLTAEQRTLLARAEPVQSNVERQEPLLRLRRPAGHTGNLRVSSESNGACVPGEVLSMDVDQERTAL
jgi:hypothetical protein